MKTFFDPWIGENYNTPNSLFTKKILVLGDSHYCGVCNTCGDRKLHPECTNMTSRVVSDYLDPTHKAKWKKTHSTFINSFWGRNTSLQERTEFYNSIVFYNYLQISAGKDAYSATNYNYQDDVYKAAFDEVLSKLSPNVVIVWGNRVWNIIQKDKSRLWLHVHHPCAGYSRKKHYKLFCQHNLNI